MRGRAHLDMPVLYKSLCLGVVVAIALWKVITAPVEFFYSLEVFHIVCLKMLVLVFLQNTAKVVGDFLQSKAYLFSDSDLHFVS